jgi:hypothetical protein
VRIFRIVQKKNKKIFFFVKGFVVSILNTSDQSEDVPVCLACAQAMRGKYRLVKIEPHLKFTCAIGKSKILKYY